MDPRKRRGLSVSSPPGERHPSDVAAESPSFANRPTWASVVSANSHCLLRMPTPEGQTGIMTRMTADVTKREREGTASSQRRRSGRAGESCCPTAAGPGGGTTETPRIPPPTPWACEGPVTGGAVHCLLPPSNKTESQTCAKHRQVQEHDAAGHEGRWRLRPGAEPTCYAPFHTLHRPVPPPRCASGPTAVNDTWHGQRGDGSSQGCFDWQATSARPPL
ncbi:uncharacterized protein LOC123786980 isoform X2 [Ursus americanus]|uniref:Uncharacterized protein LOC103672876 isoform X2 n=1 Tax=Ursus maritimus TaxID=29073 RepID=A0A384CY79_URSMA|nr:uncharacterized protein LOC103672876 isoform X2 [Ursus maritimus]XP_045645336.1 uncharacterized protein LOC123786980 isoform X2 [Ursus americanus]